MDTTETAELNRWREAGKGIGRKLGVIEERERIIKLLEEMPWQIYSGVGIDGKPIESVWTPKVLIREDAIALIKGENK